MTHTGDEPLYEVTIAMETPDGAEGSASGTVRPGKNLAGDLAELAERAAAAAGYGTGA